MFFFSIFLFGFVGGEFEVDREQSIEVDLGESTLELATSDVMRFDDTAYHLLGDQLEGLTDTAEVLLDPSTYERRSTDSSRVPGALVLVLEDFSTTTTVSGRTDFMEARAARRCLSAVADLHAASLAADDDLGDADFRRDRLCAPENEEAVAPFFWSALPASPSSFAVAMSTCSVETKASLRRSASFCAPFSTASAATRPSCR